ncbi:hypothetical protein QTN25_000637 [Entamoeba marina]
MTEETIIELINKKDVEVTKKLNSLFSYSFSNKFLIGDFTECTSSNSDQIAKQLNTNHYFTFQPVAQPVTLYFNHCEDTTTFLNCKIAVIDDTTIQIVFNEPNLLDKIRYLYALARFIQMIDVVSVNFSLPSAFTERMKGLGYYLISRTEMIHQYVGPFGKNGILIQKGHVMASADFLISDESLKLVEQYNAISRQMPLELRSLINGLPFCIFGDKALHFFKMTHVQVIDW